MKSRFLPLLISLSVVLSNVPVAHGQTGLLVNDAKGWWRFSETDLHILGSGLAITAAAYVSESPERAAANLENVPMLADVAMDVGNEYGGSIAMAGLVGTFAAIGYFGDKPHLRSTAWDMSKSLLLTGAVVGAIKVTVDRKRPNNAGYSFPSGHTATAFSVAPVLRKHFGGRVGLAAYSLAAFTALGRMEDNKHYLSDVIAGATIGTVIGRMVARGDSRFSLSVDRDMIGVGYTF